MTAEKNMLQIIQDACTDVGQPRPSVVASATDETPRRMLRLLNKAGTQLMREFEWPTLRETETFTATAAEAQTEPSITDFARLSPQSTIWHVGTQRQVIGPVSMEKWNQLHIFPTSTAQFYWTMLAGRFNIYPAPTVSDQFRYSYVYQKWAKTPDSVTYKLEFDADDDKHDLDDEMLTLELVWRWKQAIGIDYAEDMASCNRYKEVLYAGLRNKDVVNLSDPWQGKLPEGYWPGTITA